MSESELRFLFKQDIRFVVGGDELSSNESINNLLLSREISALRLVMAEFKASSGVSFVDLESFVSQLTSKRS